MQYLDDAGGVPRILPCKSRLRRYDAFFSDNNVDFTEKELIMSGKDWGQFDFIDLFAGIGGIRLGFESVVHNCIFLKGTSLFFYSLGIS
jgi:hypothetical protein